MSIYYMFIVAFISISFVVFVGYMINLYRLLLIGS